LIELFKFEFLSYLGPYGFYLLGIDEELNAKLMKALKKNYNSEMKFNEIIFKPGFTRFNVPFFLENTQIDFILNAIKFVCEHGWK